jgi:RNA polymerase sigma-70 factor, ECF subfamily
MRTRTTSTPEMNRTLALDPSLTDDHIVADVCAGNHAMFEILMLRHGQRLSRLIAGILRNPPEVEDVAQETFARAFAKLPQYGGGGRFCGWLTRIAVHEALGRKRQERRLPVEYWEAYESVEFGAELPVQLGLDPEGSALKKELNAQLRDAIERLPGYFHAVFHLRAIEGLSMRETAEHLGIPPETVKTRFHRAKRLLQEQLREHVPGHRSRTPTGSESPLLQPTAV